LNNNFYFYTAFIYFLYFKKKKISNFSILSTDNFSGKIFCFNIFYQIKFLEIVKIKFNYVNFLITFYKQLKKLEKRTVHVKTPNTKRFDFKFFQKKVFIKKILWQNFFLQSFFKKKFFYFLLFFSGNYLSTHIDNDQKFLSRINEKKIIKIKNFNIYLKNKIFNSNVSIRLFKKTRRQGFF
jgi:hypothetical protein